MAGWRVGFVVGNPVLVKALQKIKKWIDYGSFTPIQIAATIALEEDQSCVREIADIYQQRRDILIDKFAKAGWEITPPKATMFAWAKIPEPYRSLGSFEFCKQVMEEAKVALSPGISFGHYGDEYVRIAFLENKNRITQAAKNLKHYFNTHPKV